MFASGQLKDGEMYDVDFDHQFIETEKYDAKPTYKKFSGYRPGVAVIGDLIVGIENSDGNTNVRFHQKETLKRFFERFEQNGLTINRFRADCGSCSEEIVEEIEKHCKSLSLLPFIEAIICHTSDKNGDKYISQPYCLIEIS